jgi:hypothetical protein
MVSRELSAIAVLLADLARARHGLDEAYACVEHELSSGSSGLLATDAKTLAYLAVSVSQYYNAFEDLLERAARVFEGPPGGEAWHTELLRRATMDLPSLRPALVPAKALPDAFTLLKFRHFLRHSYAVKLDAQKLAVVITALSGFHPVLVDSLNEFRRFLEAMLSSA